LFNILQNRVDFDGLKTLDLFGGTGCISYEMASRGAEDLTIIEKDGIMQSFIKKNCTMLGIQNVKVVQMDVFSYMNTCNEQFDFIFAGPPYSLGNIDDIPKMIIDKKLIAQDGYFVLEHTPRNNYEGYAGYSFQRNYGSTVFSFFEAPVL
ncbi:MAG: RsmD family RNA methyltransferase, partial [Pedobacter sp.]|nr:RsmD family RNA methyltransferase [Chitinophagaceae bacterium]